MALPPGLEGWVAGENAARARSLGDLQMFGGILGLQNSMVEQQMTPLKLKQLQIALDNAETNNRLRRALLGGGAPAGAAPLAFGEGGISTPGGGQANLQTGQTIAPQASSSGGFGINPQIMSMLMSGDAGLMATGKAMLEQQKPVVGREGAPVLSRNPDGTYKVDFYAPKTAPGTMLQFGPQGVTGATQIPGYAQAVAGIEGATTGAQEAAKAPYAPPVETVDAEGRKVFTPRPAYAAPFLQGGAPTARTPSPIAQPRPAAPIAPTGRGPTPGETAAAVETGKGRAEGGVKFENDVLDSGRKARTSLTQLQILAPNLEKMPTGPLFPVMVSAGAYFKQLGIDVGQLSKDLGPAQATKAVLNQLALKLRNSAGGEGMPGAMSDKDREFLLASVPGLDRLPDGNRQLLKIMTSLEQRKIDEAQIVSRMQTDKKSSNEIRDALNQFANSRPMFQQ